MLIDLDKSVNLLVIIWSEKNLKKTEHDNIILERNRIILCRESYDSKILQGFGN